MSLRPRERGARKPREPSRHEDVMRIGCNLKMSAPISAPGAQIVPHPLYSPPPAQFPDGQNAIWGAYQHKEIKANKFNKDSLLRTYARTPDGYGAGRWEGETYIGEWKDGAPDGNGTLHGDDYYEGEWSKGRRHGKGTTFWDESTPPKPRFIGQWRNGMPFHGTEFTMEGLAMGIVANGDMVEVHDRQSGNRGFLIVTPRPLPQDKDEDD